MAQQRNRVCRLPACPYWDLAANQSWFEDMARKGLLLVRSRFDSFLLEFQAGEPQPLRYRMEPIPKERRRKTAPEETRITLYQDLGWDFLCIYAGCYIYCCADPDAPELNTDPEIHALTLANQKKQSLLSVLSLLFLGIFIFGLLLPFPLLFAVNYYGSVMLLLILGLLIWFAIDRIIVLLYIRKLYRQLASGQTMEHRKEWKHSAAVYRAKQVLLMLILLLLLVFMLQNIVVTSFGYGRIPLTDWTGNVPFVTMEDLAQSAPDHTFDQIGNGYARRWSDPVAPVNYEWMDGGSVTHSDGESIGDLLMINYHEMVSPTLAKALALDYLRRDQIFYGSQPVALENLGLDYAAMSQDGIGRPAVVLQQGSTVVYAVFGMEDKHGFFTMDAWIAAMAQRMKEGS